MAELRVEGITVRYGPIVALQDVSAFVKQGEVVVLLGANGAGKSTLLRAINGLVPVAAGEITKDDTVITNMAGARIARLGIAHVPEGRRVIAPLSVEENLLLAGAGAGRLRRAALSAALGEVYEMFPLLVDKRERASGLLSGGEQQMLALGRAVMARPEIIVMDEPSMGLAPIVVAEVYRLLGRDSPLRAGRGILLAEQAATQALAIADRGYVLVRGSVAAEGTPDELAQQLDLADAYLGRNSRRTHPPTLST